MLCRIVIFFSRIQVLLKDYRRLKTLIIFAGFLSCLLHLGLNGGVYKTPTLSFLSYLLAHFLLYLWVFRVGSNLSRGALAHGLSRDRSRETNNSDPSLSNCSLDAHKDSSKSQFWGRQGWNPNFLFSNTSILAVAIALRFIFINYPVSDDVHRYAWEGFIQSKNINPYLHPPQKFAPAYRSDFVYQGINHKELPAIYPPLSLLIFRGISGLFYTPNTSSDMILKVYKIFFICCDILIIVILVRLLKEWNKPAHWLALYAWNPLILLYGAGEGHVDILQNLFLVAFLLAHKINKTTFKRGFLILGCAVMTKYVSIVLLPFVITRKNFRNLPVFFIPFLFFLIYWDQNIFFSLIKFTSEFHYNDFLPRVLRIAATGISYHFLLLLIFFGGIVSIWLIKKEDPDRAMGLAWMWMIMCLPTVHPWYLISVVLFILHSPSRAWLTLLGTTGVNFWVYYHQWQTGTWLEISWTWYAMYIPFLFVLVWDIGRIDFPWNKQYPPPRSLDIIIPVINEESQLKIFLPTLLNSINNLEALVRLRKNSLPHKSGNTDDYQPLTCRIIVVDGGSTDNTVPVLAENNVEVTRTEGASRGNQLAAGIQAGNGDIILMLHADVLIKETAIKQLYQKFIEYPSLEWGIMGHLYDSKSFKMRLIEVSNRLRFSLTGIAFGDQGIFLRRQLLDPLGGMPTFPLMEDVELSLRLTPFSNRLNLRDSLLVSTRRWKKRKFTGYTFQVLKLVLTFLVFRRLGYDTEGLAKNLYKYYYNRQAGPASD